MIFTSTTRNLLAGAVLGVIGCFAAATVQADEIYAMQQLCNSGDKAACQRREVLQLDLQCNHGDHGSCRERDLISNHAACDKGDRGACVKFGIIIGEDKERREEWRQHHPDMFWWDR